MHARSRTVLLASLVSGLTYSCAAPALAGDWPQYRYDARRTAASPETLPAELHLHWVRELPPPRPAYPTDSRLTFDASYEPVVMGDQMFVPSMVTDSLTALDIDTGEEKWRFHADGPVRLAPVAGQGKVYFVSDDGHLYCLEAHDGKQVWKFRGLPAGRKERKLLGDQRLISLRPARGGPVLADGLIYFGAGIWPSEGIFVYALDAKTGRVVWASTDSGHIKDANADHHQRHYAGLTPQGHLAVVGERLVVPSGRQLPGFFHRKSGKRHTYTMGWGGRPQLAKGSCFIAGVGKYLFLSGDVYDTSKSAPRGKEARLVAGSFARIQMDPACARTLGRFREPVLTEREAYYSQVTIAKGKATGRILAVDLTRPILPPPPKRPAKPKPKPAPGKKPPAPKRRDVTFPELWRLDSRLKVHIKAASRLYAGGNGVVAAVDIPKPGGKPRIAWQAKISGTPATMLAADGKLFVVTRRGRIYAFGAEKRPKPERYAAPRPRPAGKADEWTAAARRILREAKANAGYALVLGVGSGRLAEELASQSQLRIIAVDPDAAKVAALRERLHRGGLYGTRIAALAGDPMSYPLPPYLARLIVSEDFAALGSSLDRRFAERIFHSLRPYGGTACLPVPPARRAAFLRAVSDARLPGSAVRQAGDLMLLMRPGALGRAGRWSHSGADAANSGTSQDWIVQPPLRLLWFDGSARWSRNVAAMLVAGGRIFINYPDLRALDVYTGQHLWRRQRAGRIALAESGLYATQGNLCLVLDPATGQETGRIALPAGKARWSDVRVSGDYLVGGVGKHVVVVDLRSGRMLWRFPCRWTPYRLAAGTGKVFCTDQLPPLRGKEAKRRGAPPDKSKRRTLAFDAKTGRILWEVAKGSGLLRYSVPHDLLVASHGIYQATDGRRLGDTPAVKGGLAVVGDKLVGEYGQTYGLLTGAQISPAAPWRKRGCTRPKMSVRMITTRVGGYAAYFDLATRRLWDLPGIRPACTNNLIPADGVLNAPCLTGGCTCNYAASSYALAPAAVIPRGAIDRKAAARPARPPGHAPTGGK